MFSPVYLKAAKNVSGRGMNFLHCTSQWDMSFKDGVGNSKPNAINQFMVPLTVYQKM